MEEILVVENDPSTRRNLIQLLENIGYGVLAAANGDEAFELLENHSPDLIISEIIMPGIDGYELLNKVNGEGKDDYIPFIFLSVGTEITDFRKAMEAGADDYITKPYKAKELVTSIETRIKKKVKLERKFQNVKGKIIRNINHSLRSPMIPIISYSKMIMDNDMQLSSIEVKDMAGKIKYSGSCMLKFLDKLLILAELEEEKFGKIEDGSNSVIEMLYQSINMIASVMRRKEDMIININDAFIRTADPYIGIMINELLENACKFSRPGSCIEISSLSEGPFHSITITDYGMGINASQIVRMSAFLQNGTEAINNDGIGLGLKIVRKIAKRNSIIVNIDSIFGEYTSVNIKLPLSVRDRFINNMSGEIQEIMPQIE